MCRQINLFGKHFFFYSIFNFHLNYNFQPSAVWKMQCLDASLTTVLAITEQICNIEIANGIRLSKNAVLSGSKM